MTQADEVPKPERASGLRRLLFILLGVFFLGLAIAGVLLPILPSTPFLLLASYFFLRSQPAWNERLLNSRWFGPLLRDWQEHRGLRPRVKYTTLVVLPGVVGTSALFGGLSLPWLLLLLSLGLTGFVVVWRLPVVHREPRSKDDETASG